MTTKITRKEEQKLWEDLMDMKFIPMDVLVLPECCKYIGEDGHGNELWEGKKRIYCLIKRV